MNETLDIPELTEDQINYIRLQQVRADAEVSNPASPYYEPEEAKRRSAARALMRKWESDSSS